MITRYSRRNVSLLILTLCGLIIPSFAQVQTLLLSAVSIDAVYFAQTHVHKSDDDYTSFVSKREALIKAHVIDPAASSAPAVSATLTLGSQSLTLPLNGPAILPTAIPDGPGVVQHNFADSFTATIPKDWMQPGLEVTVNAGAASKTITDLKIGAPSKVIMTMFDIHYFKLSPGDYSEGWLEELEAKWPVTEIELRRLPNIVFPELVVPPRAGFPAVRLTSSDDYFTQTGTPFDGEQAAALSWKGALRRAGGYYRYSLSFINLYGVVAGGQAGDYSGVGMGTSEAVLHHELGHALSLPHWQENSDYPYQGDMFGIASPQSEVNVHVGPTWGYDLPTQTFIPPTIQPNHAGGGEVGTFKLDPMQGPSGGMHENNFLLNHFSDYSVNQMQNYLETKIIFWNESLGQYTHWDASTSDYTTVVANDGVQLPLERNVQVISVMASISGSNADINMVYEPIGPYAGGLIKLFDPRNADDRAQAQAIFAPPGGCDVSLRIQQGNLEKIYMLPAPWETGQNLLSGRSHLTEAVNLPASDGIVSRVELLYTPDAEINGLPANPQVLYEWTSIRPNPSSFFWEPTTVSPSSITMKANIGRSTYGDPIEYLFTEITGNPGGTSSGWQTSPLYTDTQLQASTTYGYQITMRNQIDQTETSQAVYVTTPPYGSNGSINVDATQEFTLQSGNGFKNVVGLGTFDAGDADKLVVVIGTENGSNSGTANVLGVKYNGQELAEAIQEEGGPEGTGTSAIFYLDNPGAIGLGTIEISATAPNGGAGVAYALSGTETRFGSIHGKAGDSLNTIELTTLGENSLIITALENSGRPNASGTPTTNPPLIAVSSQMWGRQYGGMATGYLNAPTPSTYTLPFSTNTGSGYNINIAAVEILAALQSSETSYQSWASLNGVGPANGDDDLDGLSNFYEYALSNKALSADKNDNGITMTYQNGIIFIKHLRRKDNPSLAYQIEMRTDLRSGDWNPATISSVQYEPFNSEYDTAIKTILSDEPRLFIRAKVSQNSNN